MQYLGLMVSGHENWPNQIVYPS